MCVNAPVVKVPPLVIELAETAPPNVTEHPETTKIPKAGVAAVTSIAPDVVHAALPVPEVSKNQI